LIKLLIYYKQKSGYNLKKLKKHLDLILPAATASAAVPDIISTVEQPEPTLIKSISYILGLVLARLLGGWLKNL